MSILDANSGAVTMRTFALEFEQPGGGAAIWKNGCDALLLDEPGGWVLQRTLSCKPAAGTPLPLFADPANGQDTLVVEAARFQVLVDGRLRTEFDLRKLSGSSVNFKSSDTNHGTRVR